MKQADFKKYYLALQKKRKRIKYTSFLFVLFLLGVNIFAWFSYVSKADLQVDANITSWDVEFKNKGEVTNSVLVEVTDMLPGMDDFEETVIVNNKGQVDADFIYEITSASLFGNTLDISNKDNLLTELRSFYPFTIYFTSTKESVAPGESLEFSIYVKWDYEKENVTYYKLNQLYKFDPSVVYYKLDSNTNDYISDDTVTSSNFASLLDNLYLEKDDADSYFGEVCGAYENSTGNPCLVMDINLIVQQKKTN